MLGKFAVAVFSTLVAAHTSYGMTWAEAYNKLKAKRELLDVTVGQGKGYIQNVDRQIEIAQKGLADAYNEDTKVDAHVAKIVHNIREAQERIRVSLDRLYYEVNSAYISLKNVVDMGYDVPNTKHWLVDVSSILDKLPKPPLYDWMLKLAPSWRRWVYEYSAPCEPYCDCKSEHNKSTGMDEAQSLQLKTRDLLIRIEAQYDKIPDI